MPRHCRWCGRFVSANQPHTWREVRGYSPSGLSAWRAYRQLLCPECRRCWSSPSSWNRPVQPRTPINDHG